MCSYSGVPHSARDTAKKCPMTEAEFVASRAHSIEMGKSTIEGLAKEYQSYLLLHRLQAWDPGVKRH